MNGSPLDYEAASAREKTALQYRECIDSHQNFISGIGSMEMRRCVVTEIHAYDDSVKPAKFRHLAPETWPPA